MSEKKIVVPDGMLGAVDGAIENSRADQALRLAARDGELWPNNAKRIAIEAALLWLSENPIVPKTKDIRDMLGSAWESVTCSGMMSGITISAILQEWQRRMFLAPEPPDDPLVMYIMRHFEGGEPDRQALRNRAAAAVADYQEHLKRNTPKQKDGRELSKTALQIIESMRGITLSKLDADAILEEIGHVAHGWVKP